MADTDPTATARAIIDANLYMVLGTADEAGRPWVSPVYFAHSEYHEFFWVSSPETKHSHNLAGRPEISIVIFDSQVPIGTGQGVYMSASAEELTGSERERGIGVFSQRSLRHGGNRWTPADVEPPARLRLYRATTSAHDLLDANDQRVPVSL
jgi:nitroimidazol reductase NimA-like FMN-containing flavoprotein (pyridoxamine 5'-phosphate oxidase superfamily)